MTLYAEMTYFIIPPPNLSPDDYVVLPKGIIKCSDILSAVATTPFTRANTKLLDQTTKELREFTKVSKLTRC